MCGRVQRRLTSPLRDQQKPFVPRTPFLPEVIRLLFFTLACSDAWRDRVSCLVARVAYTMSIILAYAGLVGTIVMLLCYLLRSESLRVLPAPSIPTHAGMWLAGHVLTFTPYLLAASLLLECRTP